nr:hypothetical protein OH820_00340 [Streptomyces sp. NBC_00857]
MTKWQRKGKSGGGASGKYTEEAKRKNHMKRVRIRNHMERKGEDTGTVGVRPDDPVRLRVTSYRLVRLIGAEGDSRGGREA